MGKKGTYLCGKCGKDCGNPNALKMHENHCKSEKKEEVKPKEKKEVVVCDHDFRLLHSNYETEKKAILAGWVSVCKKCDDLN